MGAKKRGIALLCAALAVLLLAFPVANAVKDSFIFLGLNDKVARPLSDYTMPIYANGTYYVAYTQFDSNTTGVDLGVNVTAQKNAVSVYTRQQMLTFDLSSGTCQDKSGNELELTPAITRSGITYLPVDSVCGYFSDILSYSTLSTRYGTIVRLKSAVAILDDESFRSGAENGTLGHEVSEYLKSLNPEPTPAPTPAVSTAPGTPSPSPSPGESGRPDRRGVSAYLGFRCESGVDPAPILDLLDQEGLSAAFFFRPKDLYASDAVIRRMVGSGHMVGILVTGGTVDDTLSSLDAAQSALELIAHTRTHAALVEDGDAPLLGALEEAGWSLWRESAVLAPSGGYTAAATALLQEAGRYEERVFLGLDCSARAGSVLPRVFQGLREQNYAIRPPVETELK